MSKKLAEKNLDSVLNAVFSTLEDMAGHLVQKAKNRLTKTSLAWATAGYDRAVRVVQSCRDTVSDTIPEIRRLRVAKAITNAF